MQQQKNISDSDTAGGQKWIVEQQSDRASVEAEIQEKREDGAQPRKMHSWKGQKLRKKSNEQRDELRRR